MCATWRSCVTCGTCPLCIIFYKFGHRMPVPGRFAGCHRTSDAGSGRFAGCHRTSVAGSGPVRRMPPDVGCRFTAGRRMPAPAGLPDAIGHQEPVPAGSPDAASSLDAGSPVHRRTSDAIRRLPPEPITIGFRTAGCHRYPSPSDAGHRSPSDAGPPVRFVGAAGPVPDALCHRSGFGLSKPLHVAR